MRSMHSQSDSDRKPKGELARGDQGEVGGEVHLGSRLAGPGLGTGRLCGSRANLAVDRGTGRRPDPVCLLEFAGGHQSDPGGAALEKPLAGGAGLPADGRFPVFGTGRMWQYWPTARPLRIEYPGATHHLMSRGNQRRSVFEDERDDRRLLQGPEQTVRRFG